ncbi:hypothetical protein D1AOALGA4SA_13179 [Olavius algarvensis Delta 1 endosymbiont]|nr:hypothetical protein D1AOALGA4SA_13179 [Olavius algarvensis Delta 1 endosymbiont]
MSKKVPAAGIQSDRKRNCAKFTQFPMNSLAVSSSCSSSCSSSKLLSRFQTRARGRARGRARFKIPFLRLMKM